MEGSVEQYRGGDRGQASKEKGSPQAKCANNAHWQAFSDGNDGSLRCVLKRLGSDCDTHYQVGKGLLKTQLSLTCKITMA